MEIERYDHEEAVATVLGKDDYWTKELTIVIERPPASYSDGIMMRYEKGPRTLIVIEGRTDLVAEYEAVIYPIARKHREVVEGEGKRR